MKKLLTLIVLFLFSEQFLSADDFNKNPIVKINTNIGSISIELYKEKAPLTVENFLRYVYEDDYDGTIFHRVIKGFVIQGGGYDENLEPIGVRKPIMNESRNGLSNKRGTISLARIDLKSDSGSNQFFINLVDNKGLDATPNDMGYAVFGSVIDGMRLVDKIAKTPTHTIKDHQDVPKENIVILSIDVQNYSSAKYSGFNDNELILAASGTGFAVSHAGHILTNHHVIDACESINIRQAGKEIPATVLFFDAVNDLAILKSDMRPSSVLSIDRKNAQLMQEIFVAGYPFGESLSTSIKITKGIISSLTGLGNNYSRIQIDAALQPGNSGGPIFDDKGNVVGVAVAKLDLIKAIENFGALPENTNFGIKSSVVLNFLESNNIVGLSAPNTSKVSITELARKVTDSTYYLSCMMTMAQVRKMQSQKVMYSDLVE